jgi:hypothetical protein
LAGYEAVIESIVYIDWIKWLAIGVADVVRQAVTEWYTPCMAISQIRR